MRARAKAGAEPTRVPGYPGTRNSYGVLTEATTPTIAPDLLRCAKFKCVLPNFVLGPFRGTNRANGRGGGPMSP
eukprot:2393191-Rhodomonas_salina.1